MPFRHPRRSVLRAAAVVIPCAAAGLAAGGVRPLGAQPVLGAGEDATIPTPGQARARGVGTFTAYGSTFATGGRGGLGSPFSTDSLGPTQFPRLAPIRDTLRAITGNSKLALSLGRVEMGGYAQTLSVPISLEVGVAHRFAIGLTVPLNRTRTTIAPNVNPGGTSGNFGLNPANARLVGSTLATQALAQNGRVQTSLTAAANALQQAGAGALAAQVARFAGALKYVYGTGTAPGANAVPLVGSDAQRAVTHQLAVLSAAARAAGVTLDSTVVPFAAQARIGYPGFKQIVADSSFGLVATDSLVPHLRASLGDIELTGMFQWLNTFGGTDDSRGSGRARIAPTGLRARSTLVAGFRFGTGNGPQTFRLFDVPPATHASALLLRSITDIVFDRRWSVSGSARLAAPLSSTYRLRVAESLDSGYVPAYRERDVGRQLGRELQIEFNPRYAANEAFAVWGQALVRSRSADRYTGQFTATADETGAQPVTFDAATFGEGTAQRESRFGLGLAYSTLGAWSRGRARIPLEVSYLHAVTAFGSGATTPRLSADVLSLRVYAALRGR